MFLRLGILLWAWSVCAKPARRQGPSPSVPDPPPGKDNTPIPRGADGKYTIVADGIRAQFIPYGASITNLFIKDTHGVERDIVLGYDNASYYETDASHPHLGGVPGKAGFVSRERMLRH
jgi:aldose 1-epimerase